MRHDPERVLVGAFGELILEKLRIGASRMSVIWSTLLRFGRNYFQTTTDEIFQSWRDALPLLPFQADALILIDEVDRLPVLWKNKVLWKKGLSFKHCGMPFSC